MRFSLSRIIDGAPDLSPTRKTSTSWMSFGTSLSTVIVGFSSSTDTWGVSLRVFGSRS